MRLLDLTGAGLGLLQEALILSGRADWMAWTACPLWFGHGGLLSHRPTCGDRHNDRKALLSLVGRGLLETRKHWLWGVQWRLSPLGAALQQKLFPLAGTNRFFQAHLTRRFDLFDAMAVYDAEGMILWPQQSEE